MRVDHLQGRKIDLLVWVNTTLSDAAALKLARRGMPFLPDCLHCIIAAYVTEDSTSLQRIGEFNKIMKRLAPPLTLVDLKPVGDTTFLRLLSKSSQVEVFVPSMRKPANQGVKPRVLQLKPKK